MKHWFIIVMASLVLLASCAEEKAVMQSNPTGTLIDDRDGQTYQTVLIGNQWWMAENLNYGIQVNPFSGGAADPIDNDIPEKYCYNNNEKLCDTYGGLYSWNEAMDYSTQESARGLCPEGWHVPSVEEFQELLAIYPDCPQLRVEGVSGFNALFGGNRYYLFFDHLDDLGLFWTSSGSQLYGDYILISKTNGPALVNSEIKSHAFSLRCVKDTE